MKWAVTNLSRGCCWIFLYDDERSIMTLDVLSITFLCGDNIRSFFARRSVVVDLGGVPVDIGQKNLFVCHWNFRRHACKICFSFEAIRCPALLRKIAQIRIGKRIVDRHRRRWNNEPRPKIWVLGVNRLTIIISQATFIYPFHSIQTDHVGLTSRLIVVLLIHAPVCVDCVLPTNQQQQRQLPGTPQHHW